MTSALLLVYLLLIYNKINMMIFSILDIISNNIIINMMMSSFDLRNEFTNAHAMCNHDCWTARKLMDVGTNVNPSLLKAPTPIPSLPSSPSTRFTLSSILSFFFFLFLFSSSFLFLLARVHCCGFKWPIWHSLVSLIRALLLMYPSYWYNSSGHLWGHCQAFFLFSLPKSFVEKSMEVIYFIC